MQHIQGTKRQTVRERCNSDCVGSLLHVCARMCVTHRQYLYGCRKVTNQHRLRKDTSIGVLNEEFMLEKKLS